MSEENVDQTDSGAGDRSTDRGADRTERGGERELSNGKRDRSPRNAAGRIVA